MNEDLLTVARTAIRAADALVRNGYTDAAPVILRTFEIDLANNIHRAAFEMLKDELDPNTIAIMSQVTGHTSLSGGSQSGS